MEKSEVYKKLIKGNFHIVEQNGNTVKVVQNYHTMHIIATVVDGELILPLKREATGLAWAIGILGFPGIAICLVIYRSAVTNDRMNKLKYDIQRILD